MKHKKLLLTILTIAFLPISSMLAKETNIALEAIATTSYVSSWETLTAVNDGFIPANSDDTSKGAYGNWNNPNSIQWVAYEWFEYQNISSTEVYWYDDNGGVLTPTTAYVEYWSRETNEWINVGDIPLVKDAWNQLNIENDIVTNKLRVSMLNSSQSTGILEWKAMGTSTGEKVPQGSKEVYIPNEWDTNSNIDYDLENRSAQSDNFLLVWGPKAGTNPMNASNPDHRFNPQTILDNMENLYDFYINDLKVLEEKGNLAKYKLIIVINNTWADGVYTGWAFGGTYDNTIGAFWVDAKAFKDNLWVASHEITHAFQGMVPIIYPGHGYTGVSSSGFFWETHANFMANQKYPQEGVSWSDYPRALNFTNYYFGSPRKHYADWYLLQYLKDNYGGIEFINRIWKESNPAAQEHPIQTIQRLLELSDDEMGDLMADYGRRRINADFSNKSAIKAAEANLNKDKLWVWRQTQILDSIGTNHYAIPDNLAPQQYAFNTVRLYPKVQLGCDDNYVHLKLKGHIVNENTGRWKYSFVSVDASGNSTFSDIYDEEEVSYKVPTDSDKLYLVVTGIPAKYYVHTEKFEIGFPKLYRYPWEIKIDGAIPEGYQDGFRIPTNVSGAAHSNGGGFVANTASVSSTVYVGPKAVVLGNARISGNARIEGKAMVTGNSDISGSAIIKDFSRVNNSQVRNNAVVKDYAYLIQGNVITDNAEISGNAAIMNNKVNENAKIYGNAFSVGNDNAYGTIEIGGDAETGGSCNSGKYLQVSGIDGRAFCDGQTNHILNTDINNNYTSYTDEEMMFSKQYQCGELSIININNIPTEILISPNPSDGSFIKIKVKNNNTIKNFDLTITDLSGRIILKKNNCKVNAPMNFKNNLSRGIYFATIKFNKHTLTQKLLIK